MQLSTLISALAAAAIVAGPAFANDASTAPMKQSSATLSERSNDTMNSVAENNPRAKPTLNTANANTELPPCSDLVAGKSGMEQPNAGKLADKSTGKAKRHSKSAVHQDCIEDSKRTASR